MASKMRWVSCFNMEKELLTIINISPDNTIHDIVRKILKLPKLIKDRPFRLHKGSGGGTSSHPIVRDDFAQNAFKYFSKEDDVILLELMSEEEAEHYKVNYAQSTSS